MPKKVYNNVEDHRLIDNGRTVEDVTSVTLPTVEHPTVDIDAAGLAGVVSMPNSVKVNSMEFSVAHNNGVNCERLGDSGKHTIEFRLVRQRYNVAKGEELAGTGFVLADYSSTTEERETSVGKRRVETYTLVLRKGEDEVVMRERTPAVSSVYEVTFSCDKAPAFEAKVLRNATFEIDGVRLTLLSLSSDRSTAQVRVEGSTEVLTVSK